MEFSRIEQEALLKGRFFSQHAAAAAEIAFMCGPEIRRFSECGF